MSRRIAPLIPAGPLSRQTSEALTQAMRDLYTLFGGFTGAAPIGVRQSSSGVGIFLDSTTIQPNLTVQDVNPNSITISNVSTIEIDTGLVLTNDSGKAKIGQGGVNNQTGTTYTIAQSDRTKLVSFSNASAVAVTLPQAGSLSTSNFGVSWFMDVENRGAGTVTITPTTSTIDGSSSLALTTNQGVRIFSDGTNYYTQRGMGTGSGGILSALDKTGAIVDASVSSIKADAVGMQTWTELSASHVQIALHPEQIIYNAGTIVVLPGAPIWDLAGYAFTFMASGIGYFSFTAPLEICGYQFWCCETYTFTSSSVDNWVLPAAATVYNVTPNSGGTTLKGIVPATLLSSSGPQIIALANVGTGTLTIANNGSGTPAHSILLPPGYGNNVTLAQNDAIVLWYDTCTANKWRVLACTVSIGGWPSTGLTAKDLNPNTVTINNVTTIEIDKTSGILSLVNDGGKAEIKASLPNLFATLASNAALTTSMANIGLSVNLPAAGTYLLTAQINASITSSSSGAGDSTTFKLQDTTNNALAGLPVELANAACDSQTFTDAAPLVAIYTAPGAATINVQGFVSTSSSSTANALGAGGGTSNAPGCTLAAVRIA